MKIDRASHPHPHPHPHSRLDDETLDRITPYGVIRSYGAGEVIHHRGDPPINLGIILSGGVALSATDRRGVRLIAVILLRGEIYGAYPLQSGRQRSHDAYASANTQVLTFNRKSFGDLLDVDRDFRDRFIILQLEATDRAIQMLDDERRLPLLVRLAKLLLRHSRNPSCAVELTQSELAQLLAVSRYALGRDMGKLAQEGLVKTSYGRTEVVSRERLRKWVVSRAEMVPT